MAKSITVKLALIYDFDGTLMPGTMQNTLIEDLGKVPNEFWAGVNAENSDGESEQMLIYLRHLAEALRAHCKSGVEVDALYAKAAQDVSYFPGVENWFKLVQEDLRGIVGDVKRALDRSTEQRVPHFEVHHYVISAGITEILNRISITDEFTSIFASQYWYGSDGMPVWLARYVSDTVKTQFIFRINKGKESLSEDVNQHVPEHERPIPFTNMIYFGDGMSDVPAMSVVKAGGGRALAVYDAEDGQDSKGAREGAALVKAGRADAVVPANYEKHSTLHTHVAVMMQEIVARSVVEAFAADKP